MKISEFLRTEIPQTTHYQCTIAKIYYHYVPYINSDIVAVVRKERYEVVDLLCFVGGDSIGYYSLLKRLKYGELNKRDTDFVLLNLQILTKIDSINGLLEALDPLSKELLDYDFVIPQ